MKITPLEFILFHKPGKPYIMNDILARKCEGDIFIVDNDTEFVINLDTNI
jgi:hypothetical protein